MPLACGSACIIPGIGRLYECRDHKGLEYACKDSLDRDASSMLRLRWVILIWVIGLLVMAYGFAVELGIRYEVGSGPRRFAAHLVYHGELKNIATWHECASSWSGNTRFRFHGPA